MSRVIFVWIFFTGKHEKYIIKGKRNTMKPREAYKHTTHHRKEIEASEICGCVRCYEIFRPIDIVEWIDEKNEPEITAMCPRCGVDAVIGSASGYPITQEALKPVIKSLDDDQEQV